MRILLQRVSSASVTVDGRVVGAIDRGMLLLTGFGAVDETVDVNRVAERVLNLRIFPDDRDRLQYTLGETGGGVLAVPQFTLYARTDRGRRPDFTEAMDPGAAAGLFQAFVEALARRHAPVAAGLFGASMSVALVNDGPFTLPLEW